MNWKKKLRITENIEIKFNCLKRILTAFENAGIDNSLIFQAIDSVLKEEEKVDLYLSLSTNKYNNSFDTARLIILEDIILQNK